LTTTVRVGIFSNMQASLLVRRRVVLSPDAFAELVIWRLPQPTPPATHSFKYRLAYVVEGQCVVRHDNERGKGDHRHFDGHEMPYGFSSPEHLMRDFQQDIERWNHEHGRS
jgi:hypothetical protein